MSSGIRASYVRAFRGFNVNDQVKVRLTDHGRQVLFDEDQAWRLRDGSSNEEDPDGWSTWQLWDLMATFGKHIYHGCDVPFETEMLVQER